VSGVNRAASRRRDVDKATGIVAAIGYVLLSTLVLFGSLFVVQRLGLPVFATAIVGTFVAVVYTVVSFRHLSIPFFVWILSIGGFRFLWSIQTPLLPDLFLDRITMVWLVIVFLVKYVAERRTLRGPYHLDMLICIHALYILAQVIVHDMVYFHDWTMSILIPYSAFFLTKNIITNKREIRKYLWVLLTLSVYYNVTSVAEKYDLAWLIWPKSIITQDNMFRGRSVGPFGQAALMGTVIGMLLPIHLYFIATVKRTWLRIVLGLSFIVGFAGLYFTYTRGSWIAGLAALFVAVWLNRRDYLKYLVPAVVIVPIIAVAVLGLAQDKFMKERVENEDTIGSRLGTAVTILRVWRDNPVFGVGFFEYRNVLEDYVQPVEIPGMPTIRFVQFRHNPIHDIYLGPLAENGLVGAMLQIVIYVLIFKAFLRGLAHRNAGGHVVRYVYPILGGVMAGYLVGGLAFDYRFFSVVGTFFMSSAGAISGIDLDETMPTPLHQIVAPVSREHIV
jgi:O-antigen ligase